MPRSTVIQPRPDVALAGLCLVVYLLTGAGFVFDPDGRMVYAMTRSLVEYGNFAVEQQEPAVRSPDDILVRGRDGLRYAPYNPGQALAAIPFYLVGKALAPLAPRFGEYTAADFVVSTFNSFVTAATVWLLVRLALELGYPMRAALITGAAYGFGSMAWLYSRTFQTEPLTALWLLLAVLLLVRSRRASTVWPWVLGAGLAAGAALFTRVNAVVFVPGLLLYTAVVHRACGWRTDGFRQVAGLLAVFAGGAGLFVGATLWYNAVRFGNPLETGYTAHHPELLSSFLSSPDTAASPVAPVPSPRPSRPFDRLPDGLYGMLLSPGKSVFLFAPVLFASLAGVRGFARRHAVEAALIGLTSASVLLLHAVLPLEYWFGGVAWGPRYLLLALPLATLPSVSWFSQASGTPRARMMVSLGLAIMVVMQIPSVAVSYVGSFARAWALGADSWETNRFMVDSWVGSQYAGQWHDTIVVTQRVLSGQRPSLTTLRDVEAGAGSIQDAEVLNTYQLWWFRLVWSGRLRGAAQVAVLGCVSVLLLLAAWLSRVVMSDRWPRANMRDHVPTLGVNRPGACSS